MDAQMVLEAHAVMNAAALAASEAEENLDRLCKEYAASVLPLAIGTRVVARRWGEVGLYEITGKTGYVGEGAREGSIVVYYMATKVNRNGKLSKTETGRSIEPHHIVKAFDEAPVAAVAAEVL